MGRGVRRSFPSAAFLGSHASSAILLCACWHVVALAGGCVNLRVSWGGSPYRLNVCSAVTADSGTTPLPKETRPLRLEARADSVLTQTHWWGKAPAARGQCRGFACGHRSLLPAPRRVQWDLWKHTSNMSPALALSWRPVPTCTPRNQCPLGLRGLPNPDLVLGRMDVVLES